METTNRPEPGSTASITAARAREILELSSDSVTSELEHARGHLREAAFGGAAGYYRIEGVAGALGALANAWGRITLWSRAIGANGVEQEQLSSMMDSLVDVHRHLAEGTCGEPHVERLRRSMDELHGIYSALEARDPG